VTVSDRPNELRYEIEVDGEVAGFLMYRIDPGVLELVHTDVDPKWEGKGVGAALVQGALDDVRARGLKVRPYCPFVAAYIRRHPEYEDLATP
jgi:predicted GNAT family acetyltransferase